jgi:hypothetical protein
MEAFAIVRSRPGFATTGSARGRGLAPNTKPMIDRAFDNNNQLEIEHAS